MSITKILLLVLACLVFLTFQEAPKCKCKQGEFEYYVNCRCFPKPPCLNPCDPCPCPMTVQNPKLPNGLRLSLDDFMIKSPVQVKFELKEVPRVSKAQTEAASGNGAQQLQVSQGQEFKLTPIDESRESIGILPRDFAIQPRTCCRRDCWCNPCRPSWLAKWWCKCVSYC